VLTDSRRIKQIILFNFADMLKTNIDVSKTTTAERIFAGCDCCCIIVITVGAAMGHPEKRVVLQKSFEN
jgi:hypothetical protein